MNIFRYGVLGVFDKLIIRKLNIFFGNHFLKLEKIRQHHFALENHELYHDFDVDQKNVNQKHRNLCQNLLFS